MSASEAVSLADIFRTFFPLIAASASSLAFFFSFASVTPLIMVSRVFSAFSFSISVGEAGVDAVSQLVPLYPASHPVHVHDPVVPPMVPPLMQYKLPSEPSLLGSVETVHKFGEHVALVNTRFKHEDVPETVYPVLHVGWQEDPLTRVSVQAPAAPLRMYAALHAFSLRTQADGGPQFRQSELA